MSNWYIPSIPPLLFRSVFYPNQNKTPIQEKHKKATETVYISQKLPHTHWYSD